MRTLTKQKNWQWWKGCLVQLLSIVLLLTAGSLMQTYWGMTGLILTELMYLILAVGITLIKKTPLKEVFPVRLPGFKDIIGAVFVWIGFASFSLMSSVISMLIFPEAFANTSTSLSSMMLSKSALVTYLVVACMPAICEEAISRGVILSYFRDKKPWLIVLLGGIFFGLFHCDPARFLPTAILGAGITYTMVKRDNMVLGGLVHLLNNSLSVFAVLISAEMTESMGDMMSTQSMTDAVSEVASQPLTMIGSYMIIGCIAPLILMLAYLLLTPKEKRTKKSTNRRLFASIAATVLLFVGGLTMVVCELSGSEEFTQIYNESLEQLESEAVQAE